MQIEEIIIIQNPPLRPLLGGEFSNITIMKKIKLFLILIAFLQSMPSFAQLLQWQNTLGSTSNDLICDIYIDHSGATYVAGHSFSAIDLNPLGASIIIGGNQSFGVGYLVKYNASKQIEWVYAVDAPNVDDYINSVSTDANGNVYITGYVGGFYNAATHPDSLNLIGSQYGCGFLIKLSSDGSFLWGKSFVSQKTPSVWAQPPWPVFVNGLKLLNKGNEIVLTGVYQGVTQFDPDSALGNLNPIGNNNYYNDIFVCSYATDGDFNWVFRLASQGTDTPSDIDTDAQGNILISGLQGGALDFDPAPLTNYGPQIKGTSDCFIAKYTPQGAFIWAYVFGGRLASDRVNGLATDEHSNVYIAGEFRDTVNFAPTSLINNGISKGLKDAYIARYSPNKVLQWVKTFGNANDNESFKYLDYEDGKLFTCGSFANELILNDANAQINYSNGFNDVLVAIFDTNGIALQSFALGSKQFDEGLIIKPNGNNVIIGGYYKDTIDFALDTSVSLATVRGGYDFFLAEYDLNILVNNSNFIDEVRPEILVYPNPNNANFSVNFTEQKIAGTVKVYDLNGQLLYSEYVAPWSSAKELNLQNIVSNGMYALRLSFGDKTGVVKFVVKR